MSSWYSCVYLSQSWVIYSQLVSGLSARCCQESLWLCFFLFYSCNHANTNHTVWIVIKLITHPDQRACLSSHLSQNIRTSQTLPLTVWMMNDSAFAEFKTSQQHHHVVQNRTDSFWKCNHTVVINSLSLCCACIGRCGSTCVLFSSWLILYLFIKSSLFYLFSCLPSLPSL